MLSASKHTKLALKLPAFFTKLKQITGNWCFRSVNTWKVEIAVAEYLQKIIILVSNKLKKNFMF